MKQEIRERIEKIGKGEVPEGYRKTKVGIIPVDWGVKMLGEKTTKIGSGITPTGGEKVYKSEGRPFLRSQNVGWGNLILEDIAFIGDEIHNTFKATEIIKNDVFLNITGASIGRSAIADERVEMGNVNQHVCIIRTIENELNPKFLNYFLLSKNGQKQIDSYQAGGNRQGLNFGQIKSFQIPLPPIPEQTAIVTALSCTDAPINQLEKLIKEKNELKRGLMQRLLAGKLRFKEFVKNPNLQEVKRYSILPEEWGIKKASSIFSNISKKNNGNEQLLSATQDNGVIPRDMLDGDVMSPGGDTNSYKLVEEGDFVISLRSFQGGLEYSCYRGMVSPAYTVLKNKIPICKDFYRHLFKSRLFIDRLASSVIGIRDGKQISYEEFSFMLLPYPELKEQEKIASMLNNIDNNIELLKSELNQLKEQKRGLMQLLLTGIVRVEVD